MFRNVRSHPSAASSKLGCDGRSVPATVTILIADRFPVVRYGLHQVVDNNPRWVVIAEAEDGLQAVRRAVETQPDVAILGHSLPLLNGVIAAAEILKRTHQTEVLIYATRATSCDLRTLSLLVPEGTFSSRTAAICCSLLSKHFLNTNRSSPRWCGDYCLRPYATTET
jgi:DNA-binding NarL/FixJ family response regulator